MSYIHAHMPIPIEISFKVSKCICKITVKYKGSISIATGFFMRVSDTLKYLITNNHVVNEYCTNKDITIEIWNKKIMDISINGRFIKFFNLFLDITAIEIKETDSIYKDIEFLDYDLNYLKGYGIYKDSNIFSLYFPSGGEAVSASGKVTGIDKE